MRSNGYPEPLATRPFCRLWAQPVLERVYREAVAGPGAAAPRLECSSRLHSPGIFRSVSAPNWLSHFQVDLPASHSGCADRLGRFGVADLFVPAARNLSIDLPYGPRHPGGSTADALAPRDGRERSTLERAGQRSGGAPPHMKAAVSTRDGPER